MLRDGQRLFDLFCERRGLVGDAYDELELRFDDELMNMDDIVDALHGVHERGDEIVILPDFDMDGIMSGVVGYAGMSELGFDVRLFSRDPTRGYDVGVDETERLMAEFPDASYVITCDVGITCVTGISMLRQAGYHVLVTDHHTETVAQSVRDFAEVIVDPCAFGETTRLPGICGANVFWQVLRAYAKRYCDVVAQERIERLSVFAGIGTISDVMPLVHDNRQLVRDAVSTFRVVWSAGNSWFVDSLEGCPAYRAAFRGLFEVGQLFHARGRLHSDPITEDFFAFYMAPTFNSCKRLGVNTSLAFSVFFGDRPEVAIAELYNLNEQRKKLKSDTISVIDHAHNALAPHVYYLSGVAGGVVGLVAQHYCEQNGLPTIVVDIDANGRFYGSGRSPSWYPCLSRCRQAGFDLRGHEGAFGLSGGSWDELRRLADFLAVDCAKYRDDALKAGDITEEPEYEIVIDTRGNGDIGIDMFEFRLFLDAMDAYRPFGSEFPEPRMLLRFDAAEAQLSKMGAGEHLRFTLPFDFTAVMFNQGYKYRRDLCGTQEVVGCLNLNKFRGNEYVQFKGDWVV